MGQQKLLAEILSSEEHVRYFEKSFSTHFTSFLGAVEKFKNSCTVYREDLDTLVSKSEGNENAFMSPDDEILRELYTYLEDDVIYDFKILYSDALNFDETSTFVIQNYLIDELKLVVKAIRGTFMLTTLTETSGALTLPHSHDVGLSYHLNNMQNDIARYEAMASLSKQSPELATSFKMLLNMEGSSSELKKAVNTLWGYVKQEKLTENPNFYPFLLLAVLKQFSNKSA